MSVEPLACPCGEIPKELHIYADHNGAKYAHVSGTCCGEWKLEYRNNYADITSELGKLRALTAWNAAPRRPSTGQTQEQK